jgi:lipoate-protein ligase B
VGRGGGCVFHTPGQLCVYPIASLTACEWSVGEFLQRFRSGLQRALAELGVSSQIRSGNHNLWGRSGMLAAMGVAVQHWVTCHGAFLNVSPCMSRFTHIDAIDPNALGRGEKPILSSLFAERRLAIRMTSVRAALVGGLTAAFDCTCHHIHSGHPLLRSSIGKTRERIARAS